jgi:hypothetical protein
MATFQGAVDTAANWASYNRTPLLNEWCFESDTGKFKIGNGSTAYNSLPYGPTRLTVEQLPTGGVFHVYYDGANWKDLAGNTISSRPSARTDIRMVCETSGTTLPAWAIAGDILWKLP